jgi:hypothetical protein
MSLGVVVKGPEGLVLAADSRVTLEAQASGTAPLRINFDNATKLLNFSRPQKVGVVTYGAAVIGLRTAHSFIPELEENVLKSQSAKTTVEEYAELMSEFFSMQWKKVMPDDYSEAPMTFIVAGFGPMDAYGRVYLFEIPHRPEPEEQQPGDTNFGMTWGGQLQVGSRLIHGYDPALPGILKTELELEDKHVEALFEIIRNRLEFRVPYQVLPLQDCVNLATLVMRTTMDAQNLALTLRGVGGLMELATITRTEGLIYVQKKDVTISNWR